MVNFMGDQKVYTVPEINAMFTKLKATPTFEIVSELPDALSVDDTKTYYLVTGETTREIVGYRTVTEIGVGQGSHQEPIYAEYPKVVPYMYKNDTWYSVGSVQMITDDEIRAIVDEALNPTVEPEPEPQPIEPGEGPLTAAEVVQIWNSVPDGR